MNHLELLLGMIGAATGLITLLTTLSKLQSLLTTLQARDRELKTDFEHQVDRLELYCNGLKERIEHCNTRLSNQTKDLSATVADIESFLQKNTAYERRNR